MKKATEATATYAIIVHKLITFNIADYESFCKETDNEAYYEDGELNSYSVENYLKSYYNDNDVVVDYDSDMIGEVESFVDLSTYFND